jgi:hypothetical protein
MEGRRTIPRTLLNVVLLAAVLMLPAAPAPAPVPSATCELSLESVIRIAGEGKQPENRGNRERCKRTDNPRATAPKGCSDGGERLPQDKRSPLDDAPPLSPLVA